MGNEICHKNTFNMTLTERSHTVIVLYNNQLINKLKQKMIIIIVVNSAVIQLNEPHDLLVNDQLL